MQKHITVMINAIAQNFGWSKPQLLYQKQFWESELLEGSFCKLLVTGFYVQSVDKKWNLTIGILPQVPRRLNTYLVSPRIIPSSFDNPDSGDYKKFLKDSVGNDFGG